MRVRIDDNWEFVSNWSQEFLAGKVKGVEVQIPHTVAMMPLHDADDKSYQMVSGYRRKVYVAKEDAGMRHFIVFDACAHIAVVYFNGQKVAEHRNGYTGFRVDVTDYVMPGEENDLCVMLDSSENGAIPPFGFVIDYLTYGGIYRHVYYETRQPLHIQDVFVTTPTVHTVDIAYELSDETTMKPKATIFDGDRQLTLIARTAEEDHLCFIVHGVKPWTPDAPHLYTCRLTLGDDVVEVEFGFRTIALDDNRLILNGAPFFVRGLNRHQSFPYIGYAAPDSLQEEDARILKEELGVNAVRTSHYPQSHAFLHACDRLGLLVFTEIPGWQHLGDEEWKKQAIINTEEMVKEYRNHVSIFLWGVRINESLDDDELYTETNRIAHRLDPSRPTSGVRYLEKSSLLEDVYAYNDFSHSGANAGVRKKADVTPDIDRPLLITEANGHMFPTKSFDPMEKRQEHALRHAKVLNDAMEDEDHLGCFQWCMFDYQTHKDFGSGDRVCYHGVMDMFRNPKIAAAVYASQAENKPVLEIGTSMDIGDYPGGHIDGFYVFTNADEVRLYKNDAYVGTYSSSEFKALEHGPIKIDDLIGDLLKNNENLSGTQERLVRESLNAAGKYGMANLPLRYKASLGWCMARYGMTYEKGVELYGKYVGGWGGGSVVWRFDAVKDGKVVATRHQAPDTSLEIEAKASSKTLCFSDTYDMALVRLRIVDGNGNVASYCQLPLVLEACGSIALVGPSIVCAEGGMCGTYVKTVGQSGKGVLTIKCEGLKTKTLEFLVEGE